MKFIAGSAAAALVVAGLSFATAPTATAGPYAGTVNTNCKVSVQKQTKRTVKIKAVIKVNGVTGNVKGARTVQILNKKGKVKREATIRGGAKTATFNLKAKKKVRNFTVVVSGDAKANRFKDCSASTSFSQ